MKFKSNLVFSSVYGINLLFVSLLLAWMLMLKFDFFYATWHDVGGIKSAIEEFGPQNRYKDGFENTTKAQRVEIFHQISVAVHGGGEGLDSIRYQSPTSRGSQLLLREAEVIHLQDVANLIDALFVPAVLTVFMWPVLAVYYFRRKRRLPDLKHQSLGFVGVLALAGLCLLVFGAKTVFNTLHIWIFPDEHQWFFFYQDSLMSTMMYAPYLFAWIAAAWVGLSVGIYFLINFLMVKVCRKIS